MEKLFNRSCCLPPRTWKWHWKMLQARNIKQLHKPLIWNSSFCSSKTLVLIKYRCQAPPLQFSKATHKTTSSVLDRKKASNKLECTEMKIRYGENRQPKMHIPSLFYNVLKLGDSLHLHCRQVKVNICSY